MLTRFKVMPPTFDDGMKQLLDRLESLADVDEDRAAAVVTKLLAALPAAGGKADDDGMQPVATTKTTGDAASVAAWMRGLIGDFHA